MATQPTNDLLVWANTDVNLPNLAGPNKTQPSADLVAKGWDFKQKPSADEFNYILNNLSEWVEYLKTLTAEGTPLNTPSTLVKRDASGNFAASMVTSNLTGDVTGNADTASKWQTARTLELTGAVTGSVSVDGSGNVSMATSISASSGVAILRGTVLNGGTIPLPAGYTEEQCKWMVSPLDTNVNGTSWDWAEGVNARHIKTVCVAYLSRNVVAYTRIWRDGTNDYYDLNASANYIIIGVK